MDFWEIYDRHYARVRGYAASMLRDGSASDDVVQETFLRAQTNLEVGARAGQGGGLAASGSRTTCAWTCFARGRHRASTRRPIPKTAAARVDACRSSVTSSVAK